MTYRDPFATEQRAAETIWRARAQVMLASIAYMEACDGGLHDAPLGNHDDAIWLDDDGEEWRDEQGRTWPEHVRSLDGFKPEFESMIDSPITEPLARARRYWSNAMRIIEELPDPRGVYESNCLGWPGRQGRCCYLNRCQTWPELGLDPFRRAG